MTCEFPPAISRLAFRDFLVPNSQNLNKGEYQLPLFVRLEVRNYDQYYSLATSVVFFYDFLLTLGDEVSDTICVATQ